jgi:hypothetical protein
MPAGAGQKKAKEPEGRGVVCMGIDIGLRHLSFCVLRGERKSPLLSSSCWRTVSLLELLGLPKDFSCKKINPGDLHDIGSLVLPKLFSEAFLERHGVGHIAIEMQPHGKYANTRMIVLSHLLLAYFRGLILRSDGGGPRRLQTAGLVSASSKYPPDLLKTYGLSKQRNYAKRKALGVTLMRRLCGFGAQALFPIAKADDYADSFLLAFHSLRFWGAACTAVIAQKNV